MLFASIEEQTAWHSGRQKDLKLTFSDGTVLTNEDIASEQMSLEQSINIDSNLVFGTVTSSCFKVRVLGVVQRFKGLNVHAELSVTYDDKTYTRSLGHFTVQSDVATADRLYRDLECYDAIYSILTTDYSEWHNGLTFPMTLKQYRDAFFTYVGIEQEQPENGLINDSIQLTANFVAQGFSGQDLLKSLCEINGVFGFIDYNGKFKYVQITPDLEGLYPSNTLYPNDDIFPKDKENYIIRGNEYIQGSLKYEEYECQNITRLQIRMTSTDVGIVVGEEGNDYVIEDNPYLYGLNNEQLTPIATRLLEVISIVTYTPCSVKIPGSMWHELGDVMQVISDVGTAIMLIGSRTLSGITALFDEYSCQGEEYNSDKANSVSRNLISLSRRTNELKRTVDETVSTVTRIDGDLTVAKSEIRQNAEQIALKVSKGQVSSEISVETGQITIGTGRLTINATNFTLTREGNVSITGTLTAKQLGLLYIKENGTSQRVDYTAKRFQNWMCEVEGSYDTTIALFKKTWKELNNGQAIMSDAEIAELAHDNYEAKNPWT